MASPSLAPTPLPQVQATPAIPQMAPKAPTTSPGTPYAPGVNTYATNPQSDLRGQTIVPGAGADRNAIAQNQVNTWNASSEPQYQADLRSAVSAGYGRGQGGSGQLRTSLGNLAYNRDLQRNSAQSNYLNSALTGSIDDAYKNVGIAQNQQQFQAGLQNQTFNQGLQALQAGSTGNPADTQLALSGIYSNNANNASNATSNLIGGSTANNTQQGILQQLQGLYGPSTQPTPVPQATIPILNDNYGSGYMT